MKRRAILVSSLAVAFPTVAAWTLVSSAQRAEVKPTPPAASYPPGHHIGNSPVPADNPRVPEGPGLFKKFTERAKQGNIDLLFMGDSITEGWSSPRRGLPVWERYYAKRNAYEMGIGGDRTEHLLYRILNGNVDGISPKVVVILIGVNNSYFEEYSPGMIGDGMIAIVEALRQKLPNSKILFLSTFPCRDGGADGRRRSLITAQASAMVEKMADDKTLFYMDIGSKFLNSEGGIDKDVMYDGLHPATKGYEIWAAAIEDKVAELLDEKKAQ